MAEHNEKGLKAEDIVAKYLSEQQMKILERNWRFGHKEIDIISMDGDKLAIVEVKARSIKNAETPAELLSGQKMRHLVDAAEEYIIRNDIDNDVRFDFALVLFGTEGYSIDYVKDAFIPGVNW
ncbi:MAG: YraN family protein [Bacteroidales bacterium]|nr:YraN family protein [Bacteroidales bacterium]